MSDAARPPAPARRPRSLAIHPSILSADFANLERELGRIATADLVHVDVMDNHFVPNLTLGLPVVERLAQVSPVPLDCHLMIADPDRWAPQYAQAGAASVTAHLEAVADPRRLVAALRAAGARPALAISPGTPVDALLPLLGALDMVLVMTVEPGFGGQSFREDCLPKVRALREAADREGVDLQIQVDGGVSGATIGACAEAGADVFVAGSAVYGAEDPAAAVDALRETARRALGG